MLPLLPSSESAGVIKELASVFVVLVNPRSVAKMASGKCKLVNNRSLLNSRYVS